MNKKIKCNLVLVCGRCFSSPALYATLLLLMGSFQPLTAYAQSGFCYASPFGTVKVGAVTSASIPVEPTLKKDDAASLATQSNLLPEVPKEIARIRRGYISGFVSAYPNSEPIKSWFGVDLDRRAAYSIELYVYGTNSQKLKSFIMPRLNATTWARKWVGNSTTQIEIVKYLPGNVGATNFSSFVCSANALWANKSLVVRSGVTDALSSYAFIVDQSVDGKWSYAKSVRSGDPVYDAILGIRARMP